MLGGVALLLLGVAVLFPSWVYQGSGIEEVYEPTTISSYDATFQVGEDGSMRVVETIVVEVSTIDRHGIFRYFDRADPNAPELTARAAVGRCAAGRRPGSGRVPHRGPGPLLRREDRRP